MKLAGLMQQINAELMRKKIEVDTFEQVIQDLSIYKDRVIQLEQYLEELEQ